MKQIKKPPPIACPHCGHRNGQWQEGSAWELKRPAGETRCDYCREWIKIYIEGDEPRVFRSWPELEAAIEVDHVEAEKLADRIVSVPEHDRSNEDASILAEAYLDLQARLSALGKSK
jgi:hypothetical protein